MNENKLKHCVTIRSRSDAVERLDRHLAVHPKPIMPDVVAAAINFYLDYLEAAPLASPEANKVEADKLEMPAAITSG